MTIYVFSDSHEYALNMLRALRNAPRPDMLIHLGDGEYDLQKVRSRYPDLKIVNVCGNNDTYSSARVTEYIDAEGVRIMATHGHKYGVNDKTINGLKDAASAARPKVSLVLYGHTHLPFTGSFDGLEYMNPGTCKDVPAPTYGVVEISEGSIKTSIVKI